MAPPPNFAQTATAYAESADGGRCDGVRTKPKDLSLSSNELESGNLPFSAPQGLTGPSPRSTPDTRAESTYATPRHDEPWNHLANLCIRHDLPSSVLIAGYLKYIPSLRFVPRLKWTGNPRGTN